METNPEDSKAEATQNLEAQPNLDSAKEGVQPPIEGSSSDQKTATPADNSNSEGNTKNLGNYGPWMMVKKQRRKKPTGKTPTKAPPKGQGSRFDLLQEEEIQEDATIQHDSDPNSTSPKVSQQEQAHPTPAVHNPKTVRIRDPKAGKNSQASQDKRKQQSTLSQKKSNSKSTPAVSVTHNHQLLGSLSKPVTPPEKPSSSTIPDINALETKRKKE
ncbi:hypothetical protein SESBI_31214 [Sesbania bispinosa]|nr:hypothetical protein SESBI_31214 [Sesbania bispinosa]